MKTSTRYVIDENMRIVAVGGDWEKFGQENQAQNLSFSDVKNRSIFDFVLGETSRIWLHSLIRMAMETKQTVHQSYRCDSPDAKRYMLMTITPEENGNLTIEHTLTSEQPRQHRVEINYSASENENAKVLHCNVCGKLHVDGEWIDVDRDQDQPQVYHNVNGTTCEQCLDKTQSESVSTSADYCAAN